MCLLFVCLLPCSIPGWRLISSNPDICTLGYYQFHTNICLETSTNCFMQLHSFKYESMIWYPYQHKLLLFALRYFHPQYHNSHVPKFCSMIQIKIDTQWAYRLFHSWTLSTTTLYLHNDTYTSLSLKKVDGYSHSQYRCGMNQQILLITLGSSYNDDRLITSYDLRQT